MSANAIPDLKRITFFNGQRLNADDLSGLQGTNRELRWLHNRSLHGWGIGTGYGVHGEAGETKVTIDAGYALDCLGRELILTEPLTVTVPASAGQKNGKKIDPVTFYLTITYLDNTGQTTLESRDGVCGPGGSVRLTEGPLVQWQALKDVKAGLNVVLAEASVLNCQLNAPLGLGVRRNARPSDQPYINAGQVPPASIDWAEAPGGIIAHVDTTAARFSATPAYFMHVMGSRSVFLGSGDVGSTVQLVTVPMVASPTSNGFDCYVGLFQVVNGVVIAVNAASYAAIINAIQWTIVWMGVEG